MLRTLQMLYRKFTAYVVRHFLYSFRSTMLSLYIPVIIAFIILTGMISYVLAMRQVEESARHEVENLVYQTRVYTDNRFQSILEQMTALADDPVVLRVLGLKREEITPTDYLQLQSHVDTIRLYNSSIIDTVYINLNHGQFTFFRGDDDYRSVAEQYRAYDPVGDRQSGDIRWQLHQHADDDRTDAAGTDGLDVYRRIGRGEAEHGGILLFRLRSEFLSNIFNRPILGGRGYLTMASPEGELLSQNPQSDMALDPKIMAYLQQVPDKSGHVEFTNAAGVRLVAVYDTLETNHWKMVAVFRRDALLDKIEYIKYTTVVVIFILIVLAVFLTNWLARYIMRPISQLVGRMEAVRGSTIKPAIPEGKKQTDEVEALGHGVEDLMGHVRDLMAQVKKDQELQRELELSVVQMQVHPHFLYNTLFAIKGLCDMGLTEDASKMIMALANFFRIGLSHGQEIIPVSQEADHARNYLYIQEMRYGDVFRYSIDIPPEIEQYSIIKLTLQPLVENAIYHGVKEKRGQGIIAIRGWEQEGMLHFTVEDDGMGMTPERLAELRRGLAESRRGKSHVGFGVFSVFERLRLHYGEAAGLEITSEPGKGTCIHVVMPARKLEESEHA